MEPASGPSRSNGSGATSKARRAPLACVRCKSRKQKCLGVPCSRCSAAGVECRFTDLWSQRDQSVEYLGKLEEEIAELEATLAARGVLDPQLAGQHLSLPEQGSRESAIDNGGDSGETTGEEESEGPDNGGWTREDLGIGLLSLGATAEAQSPSTGAQQKSDQQPPTPQFTLPAFLTATIKRERAASTPLSSLPLLRPSAFSLSDLSESLANLLLSTYFDHHESRYPFLDRKRMEGLTAAAVGTGESPVPQTAAVGAELFLLLMVFATGAALLGDKYLASTLRCTALKYADPVFNQHNLQTVQATLLLVVYSIYAADGPFPWTLTGIAVKLCVELGLHVPETPTHHVDNIQLRHAVIASTYSLDRMCAYALGRPPLIDDRDIKVELVPHTPCLFGTQVQLRKLESLLMSSSSINTKPSSFREQMSSARANLDNARDDGAAASQLMPLELSYSSLALSALLPSLLSNNVTQAQVRETMRTAGAVLQLSKSLVRMTPCPAPAMLLWEVVFRAGISLMYAIFRDPEVCQTRSLDDLNAASSSLNVISYLWSPCTAYRDLFDVVLTAFLPRFSRPSFTAQSEESLRVPKSTIDDISNRIERGRHLSGVEKGSGMDVWEMIKRLVIVV
ncbi:hypothetical protein T439DRAFT_327782 [Meredithblackwellia eburnea MCA 4105]